MVDAVDEDHQAHDGGEQEEEGIIAQPREVKADPLSKVQPGVFYHLV